MKVKILCDSTCDSTQEILKNNDIDYMPLIVNLGEDERFDTVNITNEDIRNYVKQTGKLPKTAARSSEDYKTFYKKYLDDGYDIVFVSISEQLSVALHNASTAAKELDEKRIFIVDSRSLSTGSLLLALSGKALADQGKTAKEIADILSQRAYHTQASFVVDTLDYLRKGGRCSSLAAFGANLLKIKPKLQLVDGKILSTEKYRGKMSVILKKYVDDTLALYNNPDTTRCFITHADAEQDVVDEIVAHVKEKGIFKEILVTKAGSTIYSHCGKGTLGILYINDGGNY